MVNNILVYAQLPKHVREDESEEFITSFLNEENWEWHHILTFPVQHLNDLMFARKLYKWIRFAVGTVLGAHGKLYTDPSIAEDKRLDDSHAGELPELPNDLRLYYHLSDDNEKRRMYPIDLDLDNTHPLTSIGSRRRATFNRLVRERDQGRCVASNAPSSIDAAHIVPHVKGDEYIENLTRKRSRNLEDIINDIDDPRNGLLLNKTAHSELNKTFTIMMVPNFALKIHDVIPNQSNSDSENPKPEPKYVAHCFSTDPALTDLLMHGRHVRIAHGAADCPPRTLFDATYAGVVVRTFAPDLRDIWNSWKLSYYTGGGPRMHSELQSDDSRTQHAVKSAKQEKQGEERAQRAKRHTETPCDSDPDAMDLLSMIPYLGLVPEERAKLPMWLEQNRRRQLHRAVHWFA